MSPRFRGLVAAGGLVVVAAVVVTLIVTASKGASSHRHGTSQTAVGTRTTTSFSTQNSPRPRPRQGTLISLTRSGGDSAAPSGVPAPRGNLPGWRQVFVDDFSSDEDTPVGGFGKCVWNGSLLHSTCAGLPAQAASHWFAYPDGSEPDTGGGLYEPVHVLAIRNGTLQFHLSNRPVDGHRAIAAVLPKITGVGANGALRFGAFAVRFRAPSVTGFGLSFQFWPAAASGRDVGSLQFPAGALDGPVYALLGRPDVPYGNPNLQYTSSTHYDSQWHTALTEWTSSSVHFYLDGKLVGASDLSVPQIPMHVILQVGEPTSAPSPSQQAAASGEVQVAWVSVYARDSQNGH